MEPGAISYLLKLLLLLATANGAPVLAKTIWGGVLGQPLDAGLRFPDGRPVFGPTKTVRGVLIAVAAFSVQMALTYTSGPAAAPQALRLAHLLPIAWLLWTSAAGRPFGLWLLVKPDFLAYDEGAGTAAAASFAAGLAAVARGDIHDLLQTSRGKLLRLPERRPR